MPNNYNNPQGRDNLENEGQYQRERIAEDNGTSNGFAIGSLLVFLLGLGGLATYYWTRPAPITPTPTTIINTPPNPTASVSPAPQKTTIIDRTVEKAAPPQVKVIEVQKPVAAPPKVIEVPKPFAVPGATKVIEVPKPFAVPTAPTTTNKSDTAKPIATPSAAPTPASSPASSDVAPTASPAPSSPDGNN
jgi:hypothetical protein